jgi:3-hydroxyacyl-CoA dehydrogenase
MDLNPRLHQVAVVGAAGKMGSGIALLLALEMTWRALEQADAQADAQSGAPWILNLIDLDDHALQSLLRYLREHAAKDAEKQINRLRAAFRDRPGLVDNQDMVQEFVFEVLLRCRTGRTLALAKDAQMVFEAAFEAEEVKHAIYRELASLCGPGTFFLSNTSSIPLGALGEACGLSGRIIGFHFYNPPAVQKLVEVIQPRRCDPELVQAAALLAHALHKKTVPASDVAGFIGNGHFIRDGLRAVREVERLAPEHGYLPALLMVERVTRDFLLRPMGIFQLLDYVGLDVFRSITQVMTRYLGEDLSCDLLERYLAQGVRGGQGAGGVPRAGFLKYQKGRPVAAYDPARKEYQDLDAPWAREAEARLGPLPEPVLTWKALSRDPDPAPRLEAWFQALGRLDTLGAELAKGAYRASRETALDLVRQGVANRPEDVNDVLKLGFYHLYGPVTDYL